MTSPLTGRPQIECNARDHYPAPARQSDALTSGVG
jgi:hypothetical protein